MSYIPVLHRWSRGVAQPGSALRSGILRMHSTSSLAVTIPSRAVHSTHSSGIVTSILPV